MLLEREIRKVQISVGGFKVMANVYKMYLCYWIATTTTTPKVKHDGDTQHIEHYVVTYNGLEFSNYK